MFLNLAEMDLQELQGLLKEPPSLPMEELFFGNNFLVKPLLDGEFS